LLTQVGEQAFGAAARLGTRNQQQTSLAIVEFSRVTGAAGFQPNAFRHFNGSNAWPLRLTVTVVSSLIK